MENDSKLVATPCEVLSHSFAVEDTIFSEGLLDDVKTLMFQLKRTGEMNNQQESDSACETSSLCVGSSTSLHPHLKKSEVGPCAEDNTTASALENDMTSIKHQLRQCGPESLADPRQILDESVVATSSKDTSLSIHSQHRVGKCSRNETVFSPELQKDVKLLMSQMKVLGPGTQPALPQNLSQEPSELTLPHTVSINTSAPSRSGDIVGSCHGFLESVIPNDASCSIRYTDVKLSSPRKVYLGVAEKQREGVESLLADLLDTEDACGPEACVHEGGLYGIEVQDLFSQMEQMRGESSVAWSLPADIETTERTIISEGQKLGFPCELLEASLGEPKENASASATATVVPSLQDDLRLLMSQLRQHGADPQQITKPGA